MAKSLLMFVVAVILMVALVYGATLYQDARRASTADAYDCATVEQDLHTLNLCERSKHCSYRLEDVKEITKRIGHCLVPQE